MDLGNFNSETVSLFAQNLKLKGKQPSTVESYCRDASRFLEYLDENRLNPKIAGTETLFSYEEYLRNALKEKENSIRRSVIGIRQFYRFLKERGVISSSVFDLAPIPNRIEELPESLAKESIEELFIQCERDSHRLKGTRDAAVIALLAFEGIKANEMISLSWSDFIYDFPHSTLNILGPKARIISLSTETQKALFNYRIVFEKESRQNLLKTMNKRMVIAFKGREILTPIPSITRHGLKFMLYEVGNKIGINHLNTEMLRHFAVNFLIKSGKTNDEIMSHLGLKRVGNIAKHASLLFRKSPEDQ